MRVGGKRSREDSLHRCRRCTSGERARDDHQAVCLLTACRSCRLSRTQLCMPSSVRGGRRRRRRDEQVVELNDDERGAIDGTQRGRPEMTILALKSQRLLNLQSSFNHPPVSLFFLLHSHSHSHLTPHSTVSITYFIPCTRQRCPRSHHHLFSICHHHQCLSLLSSPRPQPPLLSLPHSSSVPTTSTPVNSTSRGRCSGLDPDTFRTSLQPSSSTPSPSRTSRTPSTLRPLPSSMLPPSMLPASPHGSAVVSPRLVDTRPSTSPSSAQLSETSPPSPAITRSLIRQWSMPFLCPAIWSDIFR